MVRWYELALKKQPLWNEIILMAFQKELARQTLVCLALAFGRLGEDASPYLTSVEPPPMPQRAIAPDKVAPAGRKILLNDGEVKFTLFVPETWKASNATLTVHFHTAEWFVIQEHIRRGATHPLATFYLGESSTVYKRPFEDADRFGRMIDLVERELSFKARVIEVSSFSAGYGAVREILKQPKYFERIGTMILADSMYAAFETTGARQPSREQVQVWAPFARAAMKGEKTFVITYSMVPTENYASSSECARALLAELGVSQRDVPANSCAAASDKDFPLLSRADAGNLHVWGYGGTNAQAHMTHPRHIAEVWRAIALH